MGVKQYIQLKNKGVTPPTAEDYCEEGEGSSESETNES